MECVNCGRENLEKALICYWCSLDPATGTTPYKVFSVPAVDAEQVAALREAVEFPAIEVPAPLAAPGVQIAEIAADAQGLTIPEPPPIEIPSSPDIPDVSEFTIVRRRARHRPVIRAAPARPTVTRPALPGWGRLLIFVGGLVPLLLLGLALVTAVGAASFGSVFCLVGIFALSVVVWVGLLMARAGKRIVDVTGEAYERIEVLGQVLREIVPGVIEEIPVNLPPKTGILDQPIAFSELRLLASQEGEPPTELAVDMLTGAIASLVGRDDVILARRNYPVETRGKVVRPVTTEVIEPVLTRRRIHVGPGELEGQLARTLRTDRPMSIEELLYALLGPSGHERARRVVAAVDEALSERPPDLDMLASPEATLAEFERFRQALRRADPDLYKVLEDDIRRALAAATRKKVPSSWMDLARFAATIGDAADLSQDQSNSTTGG